jgi:hypothetical protein
MKSAEPKRERVPSTEKYKLQSSVSSRDQTVTCTHCFPDSATKDACRKPERTSKVATPYSGSFFALDYRQILGPAGSLNNRLVIARTYLSSSCAALTVPDDETMHQRSAAGKGRLLEVVNRVG